MKNIVLYIIFYLCPLIIHAQQNPSLYLGNYHFLPGETILFDDSQAMGSENSTPKFWNITSGNATLTMMDSVYCVSILEYYTRMTPKMTTLHLPQIFTVEYDTWLEAGYDGNPGIEILLKGAGDEEAVITPNRDFVSIRYPGGEKNGETPAAIRGENFYNKWNHISITVSHRSVEIYVNQFMMVAIDDCGFEVDHIEVNGNASQGMKMLMKNFKIAKDIPVEINADLDKGLLITHAIKFDSGKYILKPESASILMEIESYLSSHPDAKMEIGGYTDSEGDDVSNLALSQRRADAVKAQLILLGIDASRLVATGYGEARPIDVNTTAEGRANNRRVEFKRI